MSWLQRLGVSPEQVALTCSHAQAVADAAQVQTGRQYIITDLGYSRWFARAGTLILAGLHPGQVMWWAGPTAPAGWIVCNGQAVSAADYPALASVLGNLYGGDGVYLVSLPNLIGKFARGAESGGVGAIGGADASAVPLPNHTHMLRVGTNGSGQSVYPVDGYYLVNSSAGQPSAAIYQQAEPSQYANINGIASAGAGGASVSTIPKYLGMLPIIFAG